MADTKFKIFVPMLKAYRVKDADGNERMVLSGVASSTIRDLHGDRMEESALTDMLRAATNNLTIFLNHSYDVPEDVGGSVRNAHIARATDGIVDLHFDEISVNTVNKRAVEAFESIEAGTKLGLSIGAVIPEGGARYDKKSNGWIIEHVELLETSIVGVPANPRSWIDYAIKAMSGHYADAFFNILKTKGLEGINGDMTPWLVDDLDAEGIEPEIQTASYEVVTVPANNASTVTANVTTGPWVKLEITPDITDAKKPAGHIHPHAHSHEHEHSHGYQGENEIVHSHEHAHQHSHDHGEDHPHDDVMDSYEHDHYHNGAYEDEHAHKDAASVIELTEGLPVLPGAEELHESTGTGVVMEPIEVALGETATLTGDETADVTKATVWVQTRDGDLITIGDPVEESVEADFDFVTPMDPEISQGAPSSTPEPESGDSADELRPILAEALKARGDLAERLARELSKQADARARAEAERDSVVKAAKEVLASTAKVLETLKATPMGRRAIVTEATRTVDASLRSLSDVIAPEALSLLSRAKE